MDDGGEWVSSTDLAEYTYCPRAWHYRGEFGGSPRSRATTTGERFHRQVIGAEARRERRSAVYWAGAVLGAAVLAIAVWTGVRG